MGHAHWVVCPDVTVALTVLTGGGGVCCLRAVTSPSSCGTCALGRVSRCDCCVDRPHRGGGVCVASEL